VIISQTTKDAIKFYHGKVDDLGKNLGELEKVIGSKSDNVRIVEDGKFGNSLSHPDG
jgi:prefoldin alpha subunit